MNIVRVPASVDRLGVLVLSDLHAGHFCHDEPRLNRLLDMLDKEENMRVLMLGDMFEAKFKNSKGKPEEQVKSVRDQRRYLVSKLKKFADRIDLSVPGNHDDRQSQEGGDSLMEVLMNEIGCPHFYEPLGVVVYATDKRTPCSYTLAARHGNTGGYLLGSGLNATHRDAWNVEADIYLEGHCHKGTASQALQRLTVLEHKKRLVWRPYWVITNGSLLDPARSYAAMKGYPMAQPCQAVLTINMIKDRRGVGVEWN